MSEWRKGRMRFLSSDVHATAAGTATTTAMAAANNNTDNYSYNTHAVLLEVVDIQLQEQATCVVCAG